MHTPIFIRDSFFGRIVYELSGKSIFKHPEERADYVVPDKYLFEGAKNTGGAPVIEKKEGGDDGEDARTLEIGKDEKPQILVDWDGPDDPENPKNWTLFKKVLFIMQVGLLTTSIYIGSSIYVPGVDQIMEEFNVSLTVSYLPLSLFVIGYGLGPMIFSPMSEHPAVGRTYIYIITLAIFVILQIPTSLSENIGSLLVLRFLAGVFASPALATGGASVGDVIQSSRIPIGLASWGVCAVCGPVLGPLIGGVLAELVNWRWTFWFLLILDGATLCILTFFLPESSQLTLLYRKAQRLRRVTGNEAIISEGDLKVNEMDVKEIAIDTLWRPIEIAFGEPVVFFINIYIALMYAIMYLWFEAFPLVFVDIHGFNMIETGVGYTSIMIGVVLGGGFYLPALYKVYTAPKERGEDVPPEVFLPSSIVGAVLQPTGVFIFAWASTPTAHWIGPLIGAALFASGAFIGFQTLFNYMASSFPRYQASVFAGNGMFRACLAAAFPLFARALYTHLGPKDFPVGWGCTILGIANLFMIAIPVLFYKNGVKLRARSKYAN
jgi:DHA1 family multidrug resistance protein-like MFS transporter